MDFIPNDALTTGWNTVYLFTGGVVILWALQSSVQKLVSLHRAFKIVEGVPGGELVWFHPFRSSAPVLAPYFPPQGRIGNYYSHYQAYKKYGSTVLGSVKFWGAVPTFWVSDPEGLKTISNNRTVFRRDVEGYEVVSVYGPNMVATEGEAWKRYRTVAKPAFNEANNALVWHHATRIVNEWFEDLNKQLRGGKSVQVDLLKDCTELTLLIISSAAFGKHNGWSDHSGDDSGHRLPFRPAVTTAVKNLVPKVLTPNWLFALAEYLPLPKIIKETADSFVFLRLHMLDIINSAREWVAGGHEDNSLDAALLQNLVKANLAQLEQEETKELLKRRLTDQEVLSNAFMFLLAGHETSAHSLCFTLCLLALYPEVQEKMYQETKRLWPNLSDIPNGDTVGASKFKDDMANLEYVTAVFRESLRIFPPVPRVASPVKTDAKLTSRRFHEDSRGNMQSTTSEVNVPAGSLAVIDIIALHMNPLCWGKDAEEFRPERFVDTPTYTWPRDAFLAFSAGPRACMGERFAYAESVCSLAHIARRYKLSVPEHLVGKPFAEQKRILLQWAPTLTLVPHNASVCFSPRND
ncbi:hypothetical protein D9758_012595 [Tetrapyrgos nigripes]|uniref:Cytochrome P450 n=1 Tax=Tetrapyrgos nigripes TaxID=182062 RepID=A0A8H5CGX1_9AGAR|nr:hypothetical protein D9758_012595 [Tetrapyrgos nigripes]